MTRRLVRLARATRPAGGMKWTVGHSPRTTTVACRPHGAAALLLWQHLRITRVRRQAFIVGAVSGAAAAFVLDPEVGRQRRERLAARARRSQRRLIQSGRKGALRWRGHAKGAAHRIYAGSPAPLDDMGLAHRVESVLFRDTSVPKGSISVNAESGNVFLRGQVESLEQVEHATQVTRRIPGVEEVVNLLHLPGTPAPHAFGEHPIVHAG
jgi:BON domain